MWEDKMLEHEDFAESYQNILQNEIQKTYFDYNNFSILTACCYVRKPKASNLDIHSTAIVTEASNLSLYYNIFLNFSSKPDKKNSSTCTSNMFVESYECASQHTL